MAGQLGLDQIQDLAEAQDPAMLAALYDAGSALGLAVAGVLNVMDIDTVVLGGLYAALGAWLVPEVEREVRCRLISHSWLPATIRVSALGGDAAILGAAGLVIDGVRRNPTAFFR